MDPRTRNSQRSSAPSQGDRGANLLAMLGHICADINQGALTASLPFLVMLGGYSYFEVSVLVFASNIASAVIQPLFGWLGDKHPAPWLMGVGLICAGVGMSGIGLLQDYRSIVACAMLGGIGVAMFHPEGGRIANLAAGQSKENGMSIFAVGGNIGFFVGPILVAVFVGAFGLRGMTVLIVPALTCACVLLSQNRRFVALGCRCARTGASNGTGEHWGLFALVLSALSIRSILHYAAIAFIPLFLTGVLGQTEALGSLAISAFSIAGAVATVISGRVSQRTGTVRLMVICFAAGALFFAAFAFNVSLVGALALTLGVAVAIDLFYPSSVALGMGFIPGHLGTASGLSYGVAICVGGVAEPFLGMAGDVFGLPLVILVLAALSVVACGLSVAVSLRARGVRSLMPAANENAPVTAE